MILVGGDAGHQRFPVRGDIFDLDTKIFSEFGAHIDIKTGVLVGRGIAHRHRVPVTGGAHLQHTLFKDRMKHRVLSLGAGSQQRRGENKDASCN